MHPGSEPLGDILAKRILSGDFFIFFDGLASDKLYETPPAAFREACNPDIPISQMGPPI